MMRILLAEDHEDNRDMLSRRLRKRGFEVLLAQDGLEAVARTRAERPDLVLMDWSMPNLSGLDAIAAIRSDPAIADTPVIALTAHAGCQNRDACLQAGANAFATKPVDFKALLRLIGDYQRTPRRPRELGDDA